MTCSVNNSSRPKKGRDHKGNIEFQFRSPNVCYAQHGSSQSIMGKWMAKGNVWMVKCVCPYLLAIFFFIWQNSEFFPNYFLLHPFYVFQSELFSVLISFNLTLKRRILSCRLYSSATCWNWEILQFWVGNFFISMFIAFRWSATFDLSQGIVWAFWSKFSVSKRLAFT